MASCPACGGRIPRQAVLSATAAAAIVCPHCQAVLELRRASRSMLNLAIWLCGAGCYLVLVLLGFSRGVAFATGLVVAIGSGFFLQAWTARLARKQRQTPSAAAGAGPAESMDTPDTSGRLHKNGRP